MKPKRNQQAIDKFLTDFYKKDREQNKFHMGTMIYKFAYYHDELDEWLSFAEELIERWESMTFDHKKSDEAEYLKSFFTIPFEFRLATFMLMDNFLPESARIAYGYSILDAQLFLKDKNVICPSLHIEAKPKGRKRNHKEKLARGRLVIELIKEDKPLKEVYETVAEKFNKSPETIRREYERWYAKNGKSYEKNNSVKLGAVL